MARNIKPKQKQLRRFGLTASESKRSVTKKKSLHGERLEEKQKIKFLYGVMERQFKIYIKRAQSAPGNAIENLLRELESRLDNVVYRAGLAKTRAHARQLVNHAHILVDEKRVNIPSYQVKVGEVIQIKQETFTNVAYQNLLKERAGLEIPAWIQVAQSSAKILRLPSIEDPHEQANINMIFEFYR